MLMSMNEIINNVYALLEETPDDTRFNPDWVLAHANSEMYNLCVTHKVITAQQKLLTTEDENGVIACFYPYPEPHPNDNRNVSAFIEMIGLEHIDTAGPRNYPKVDKSALIEATNRGMRLLGWTNDKNGFIVGGRPPLYTNYDSSKLVGEFIFVPKSVRADSPPRDIIVPQDLLQLWLHAICYALTKVNNMQIANYFQDRYIELLSAAKRKKQSAESGMFIPERICYDYEA